MPFRSGLIIYYGKRFCCDKQYHNKYNILSNKMSFGDNDKKQSPRRNKTFDNRVRKTPGTFYSTLGKASSDLKFFNLISKFTNLRRCTLLICLDLTDPKNKKFRKEINRLFRQSKRLSALHVYLYNFGDVSHSNQGHFRGIRMLTALKYLEFLSAGYNISIFQKMCPFIERRTNRNYWKRLKSCRLILNPKINMAHEFTFQQEMATFLEVLKKIDEWQDRINVAQELKLYIDQKDHLDRYFAENELFNNCTSLRALDLKGNINTCFQHFFANHYQHVEDLCLEIKKTQAHERLSEITETLSSFANLKILDLNIADVLESHQLEKIFNNMKKNSMLTDFKLHLKEINAPINSFPDMLMATKNLKVFHLEVTKLNNAQFPLEEFFQSISQLFRLKELTIHMEYSSQIDDDLFEVLCESLKNLRSLELLSLNFLENKISSKGLNHLTQVMPYLLNLQTFFINLKEGYALDENSVSNFMWSLESLRFLETLTIELSLIELTSLISKSIIESIESLKCLYFVKLNLGRVDTSKGFELERKTRSMIIKLEYRIHEIRFFFN